MYHTASIFRHLFAGLLVLTAVFVAAPKAAAVSKAPLWEVVEAVDIDADPVSPDDGDASSSRLDVTVRDGRIYITVDRHVKIEVFTILGQLVTSRRIAPGTVRLTLGNKGIYIVKGAGSTRRVNL